MPDDRTWLLIARKMANEASPQELNELENIVKANPELYFKLQTLSGLWQQSPEVDTSELEAAYSNLIDKMSLSGSDLPGKTEEDITSNSIVVTRRQSFWRRKGAYLLPGLAAALIAVWFINPFHSGSPVPEKQKEVASEVSTKYGSKSKLVLPDGSQVWLNSGSRITYGKSFGESTRNVELTGEAYFDVVHNPEKPFIIHTKVMDIRVLGTEFNIKSYPEEKTTETSLIRGSIEVTLKDRRGDKILLKPNEKLVVSNEVKEDPVAVPEKTKTIKPATPIISLGTLNYFSVDSTILETSWVNNRLIFEDESFGEIAVRMSRWYGANFMFIDEGVRQLRFTGNFKDESLNDALTAMQITADFTFNISDNNVTITKTKR